MTSNNQGMKGLSTTSGPLSRRDVESGVIVTSKIPLLGDAAPGDIDEALLAKTISYGPTLLDGTTPDPYQPSSKVGDSVIFAKQGEQLVEAFNDGPTFWNGTRLEYIGNDPDLTPQLNCETSDPTDHRCKYAPDSTDPNGTGVYLQDTRDWMCVHGGGKFGSCNILMVDGSVVEFYDKNGDGFLNPGFPVDPALTDADYAEIGYRDGTVELEPKDIFSGIFLRNLSKHSKFEAN